MSEKTTEVRTTEFEDGSEIVTTTTTESEFVDGEGPLFIASETVEEIAEEIAEELAPVSDAVAIAEIEAERDVTIAAIQAETTTAIIEAETERETSWQTEAAELRTNIAELKQTVETLANLLPGPADQLTPEPLTEAAAEVAETIAEAEAANNSTPQFTLAPISETRTEVTLESADEKPEAEATATVTVKRRRRLI
jgi:dGTP triphosphohydrolase